MRERGKEGGCVGCISRDEEGKRDWAIAIVRVLSAVRLLLLRGRRLLECCVPYADLDVDDRLSVCITYRRHSACERTKKSDGPHGACTTDGKTHTHLVISVCISNALGHAPTLTLGTTRASSREVWQQRGRMLVSTSSKGSSVPVSTATDQH